MTIKVGDHLPDGKFTLMGADGPESKSVDDIFAGKKVALFAVPGAYTPTCTKTHLPGFVDRVEEFKTRGIDAIACTAVNDIFVMTNWAKDTGAIESLASRSLSSSLGRIVPATLGLDERHRRRVALGGLAIECLRWRVEREVDRMDVDDLEAGGEELIDELFGRPVI